MPKVPPANSEVPLVLRNEILEQNLAARYDALNDAIRKAEAHLRSLKPVDSVWFKFNHSDNPDGSYDWHELGLCKYNNGKWQLVHGIGRSYEDGVSITPLTDCPAQIRVMSAEHIPALEDLIIQAKEGFIPKVDEAIKLLNSFSNK